MAPHPPSAAVEAKTARLMATVASADAGEFVAGARAVLQEAGPGDLSLAIAVADLCSKTRAAEGGGAAAAAPPPSTSHRRVFVRKSEKFLCSPSKHAEVLVALARRLDVSIVGARPPFRPPPGWAGGAVVSVYADAPPSFPAHAARSARLDGAALTRLRWYGDGPGAAWVETKRHREPGSGAWSTKERAAVGRADAAALLDPTRPPPRGLSPLAAGLAAAVRATPAAVPVLATRARRLAFEGSGVRVTFDAGLAWLGGPGREADLRAWVGAGGAEPVTPLPTVTFHFCVLEVKTPIRADGTPASPPPWLAALVCDPAIAASAPRFSKYQAGTCALFPAARLDTVGCAGLEAVLRGGGRGDGDLRQVAQLPPPAPTPEPPKAAPAKPRPPRHGGAWLQAFRARFTRARTAPRNGGPLLPVTARTEAGSVGGAAAAAAATSWPPPRPGRAADAKVFFSNERTMLAWLQISVLLLLLGVSLLNGGGGGGGGGRVGGLPGQADGPGARTHPAPSASTPAMKAALVAGGVVAPASVAFMAYAFLVFRRRSARLAAGPAGPSGSPAAAFDDARGAAVLVGLVLLAGVASLAAAFARVGEGV